jgi:glucuronate isomerase
MLKLIDDLAQAFAATPILDVHTHIAGGHMGARGLHDIVLYHMVISELYAAGCPSGDRLTQFPGWPDKQECHRRLAEAVPFIEHIRNTSGWWGARIILSELYGWDKPITSANWQVLDGLIRERADDPVWHREILSRAMIERTCAEHCRRGDGRDDDQLQYSVEWGMFMRTQWGEFDTALYDLERTWAGRVEDGPCMIGATRPEVGRTIRTIEDVHAAMDNYLAKMPYDQIVSMATGISTDIDYRLPSASEMSQALSRRANAGIAERDIYAAYIGELMLQGLERHGKQLVFQFSIGAEPLPHETMSRVSQKTLAQVAEMINRHPGLRFQGFVASRHAHQSFCTLARELPNFSLSGFWWHNFFPGAIRELMDERLDMVPANKQCGFFSDAYCVEWSYAKARIVRTQMADVYAGKVAQGQYSRDDALAIARQVLYQTPQSLLGMSPKKSAAQRSRA